MIQDGAQTLSRPEVGLVQASLVGQFFSAPRIDSGIDVILSFVEHDGRICKITVQNGIYNLHLPAMYTTEDTQRTYKADEIFFNHSTVRYSMSHPSEVGWLSI